jgi:hypothetical protein
MAGTIAVVAVALLAAGIAKGIGRDVARLVMTPSSDMNFAVSAALTRITLPKKIDEMTTWVDTTSLGRTLTYHYEVDTARFNIPAAWPAQMKNGLTKTVCETKGMKSQLEEGKMYRYEYKDSNGRIVGLVEIRNSDCT